MQANDCRFEIKGLDASRVDRIAPFVIQRHGLSALDANAGSNTLRLGPTVFPHLVCLQPYASAARGMMQWRYDVVRRLAGSQKKEGRLTVVVRDIGFPGALDRPSHAGPGCEQRSPARSAA